jgi:murein DD-endopeptidase MepM/ murein hydrolase activator NlpD
MVTKVPVVWVRTGDVQSLIVDKFGVTSLDLWDWAEILSTNAREAVREKTPRCKQDLKSPAGQVRALPSDATGATNGTPVHKGSWRSKRRSIESWLSLLEQTQVVSMKFCAHPLQRRNYAKVGVLVRPELGQERQVQRSWFRPELPEQQPFWAQAQPFSKGRESRAAWYLPCGA